LSLNTGIERAAEAINAADALLISAGAGMGVDSGLPDFRGREGFWRAYPAAAARGLSFEELANPKWFSKDPRMAWAFYGHRLNLYRHTVPHEGFAQLLALGRAKQLGYFVFTSNVDGQFQKAGFSEDRIEECHGSIRHLQCLEPCGDEIWEAPPVDMVIDVAALKAAEPLPACLRCGGVARPNILMFGDWSWNGRRSEEQHQRMAEWFGRIRARNGRLAVIELGAGTAIPSVRHFSEAVAERFSATLIRINPREPKVPAGQIGLPLGAAEGVRRLCEALGSVLLPTLAHQTHRPKQA